MDSVLATELCKNSSLEDVKTMLVEAKKCVKDWSKKSRVNKKFTIEQSFNIFEKYLKSNKIDFSDLALTNMIWEFGEYLPSNNLTEKELDFLDTFTSSKVVNPQSIGRTLRVGEKTKIYNIDEVREYIEENPKFLTEEELTQNLVEFTLSKNLDSLLEEWFFFSKMDYIPNCVLMNVYSKNRIGNC